ncbi:hypothetical protein VTK73DRAFT_3405 [Phialemonium thermophilum]|uniref:Protein-S-isoprenylcysteine O-methyltransferase n=1 Tax=Phialemonium thermophilum TaxID=223376 RepID=A0ABR3X044_9PEZI
MASFSTLTFVVTFLLVGWLTLLCTTPPNKPAPSRRWKHDRVEIWVTSTGLITRWILIVAAVLYHAALALVFPSLTDKGSSANVICPHPRNLNPTLFSWNAHTALCFLLVICIAAPVRFTSFSHLGKNFTFVLAKPDHLVTTGIYSYVQHPSYTGQFLVFVAHLSLVLRWDAGPGCLVPEAVRARLDGWGFILCMLFTAWVLRKLAQRVQDEEAMLRQMFGEEWERWHRSTKRFIPGVF